MSLMNESIEIDESFEINASIDTVLSVNDVAAQNITIINRADYDVENAMAVDDDNVYAMIRGICYLVFGIVALSNLIVCNLLLIIAGNYMKKIWQALTSAPESEPESEHEGNGK